MDLFPTFLVEALLIGAVVTLVWVAVWRVRKECCTHDKVAQRRKRDKRFVRAADRVSGDLDHAASFIEMGAEAASEVEADATGAALERRADTAIDAEGVKVQADITAEEHKAEAPALAAEAVATEE